MHSTTEQLGCACGASRSGVAKSTTSMRQGASVELSTAVAETMRPIPGGFFDMGTPKSLYAVDQDSPRRRVKLDAFQMSAFSVTNRLYAQFVVESGYRSVAEREGWSFVFEFFLEDPAAYPAHPPATPWWRQVHGADWRHPEGPGSNISERMDHPVVHISWEDAQAFAQFTGTALPSEAQWEYAARGGLKRMKFPWGNVMTPKSVHRHNVWQGTFPTYNSAEDGFVGTAPVNSFEPNGYGLFNMTGNVWEWVADWFGPLPHADRVPPHNPTGPDAGPGRVMRGGSYMCHASYCARYFVHSRTHNTPDSSTGHIGFRVVAPSRI